MSQIELAEKTGMHRQQTISEIENEKVLPTPELAERIKRALNWDEALKEMQEAPDQVVVRKGENL